MQLLVMCTANICRSPMAEALLRRHAEIRGEDSTVSSAGLLDGCRAASEGSQQALRAYGFDLAAHRSRRVDDATVLDADLVLAMEQRHVREAVVLAPERVDRIYTLRELVVRGRDVGPRGDRPLDEWLGALDASRRDAPPVRPGDVDVIDPYGGPQSGYARTAAELVGLTDVIADLLWGPAPEDATPLPAPAVVDDAETASWWSRLTGRRR